jgi:AraC-like DNA-binding protein
MDKVQFFSTDDVLPDRRLDYWNDVVAKTFLGCSVDVRDEETFAAQFWRCRLGDIGIVRARASCSKVSRWKGCAPDSSMADRVTLHVLNVGHLEATQGATAASLAPGDLALCDAADFYTLDISDRNDALMVDVPLHRLTEPTVVRELQGRRLSGNHPSVALLRRFLISIWEEYGRTGALPSDVPKLNRVIVDLVGMALTREAVVAPSAVQCERDRVLAFVDEHLTDCELSTAAIAAATGHPVRTIQDLFARMGTTPTDHIVRLRLERARSLLKENKSLSITDIALQVGFNSSNYFSRLFRQRFGKNPRSMR